MAILTGTILKVVASILMPENVIAQNIFYAVVTDLVTSDDEDDVVADLVTWVELMYAELNEGVADVCAASDVKVYEYDPLDEDWDEVGSDVWTDGFALVSDMLPHGAAGLIHAKTTNPDVQAGKYIAGIGEVTCVESDWDIGAITRFADFAAVWVAPFVGTETGGTFGSGVWSTAKENFLLFNGIYIVNGLVAYQRRRKPGVGI
jgi:hypothetical protein